MSDNDMENGSKDISLLDVLLFPSIIEGIFPYNISEANTQQEYD